MLSKLKKATCIECWKGRKFFSVVSFFPKSVSTCLCSTVLFLKKDDHGSQSISETNKCMFISVEKDYKFRQQLSFSDFIPENESIFPTIFSRLFCLQRCQLLYRDSCLYYSLALKPRPSKTEKKQPSFYTNPRAPKSQPQNGTMTIVMTDMMESRDNEAYEEPEDEVQEVRVYAGFQ